MKTIIIIFILLGSQIGFSQSDASAKHIKKWEKQRKYVVDNSITEISVISYQNWKGEDKPCSEWIYKYDSTGLIIALKIIDHCRETTKYDGIYKYLPNNLCDSSTSDKGYLIKAEGNRQYPTAQLYGKTRIKNGMTFKKYGIRRMIKIN